MSTLVNRSELSEFCFLSDLNVFVSISGLQQRIASGGFIKQTMFNFAYNM